MEDIRERAIARVLSQMELEDKLGYTIGEDGTLVGAPCGCYDCDQRVQHGHAYCDCPPPALLQAEQEGLVTRHYNDGAWRWFVA